jgi:large subunit ribosomal protein L32
MPVPKRKRSRARRDKRFANKGVKVKVFTKCSNCQEVLCPHQVCKNCGHYKGKQVIATKAERLVKRNSVRSDIMEKRTARQQSLQASAAPAQESNE